jgi:hypothetical protein
LKSKKSYQKYIDVINFLHVMLESVLYLAPAAVIGTSIWRTILTIKEKSTNETNVKNTKKATILKKESEQVQPKNSLVNESHTASNTFKESLPNENSLKQSTLELNPTHKIP